MKKISAAFFLLLASFSLQAQTYPTHAIHLIIPYPPGGSNDVVGRMIAAQLSERLGQQIVVDNRGGAGGQLGTLAAAKSPPDGYTLLLISVAYAFGPALYKDLKYDPETAFAPITILGRGAAGVCVNPSVPVSNVQELIALAKSKPGQLNYASAGVGSLQHLAGALFMSQAGINVVHVPYKGGGPAMADVIAGQAQIVLPSLIQTMPYIKSGRLKCIATTGSKRSAAVPDIPTVAESGLPGYEAHNWWGMLAPAGTPAPVIGRLHAALNEVLESKETNRRFETEGAEVVRMSPQEFGRFISSELAKWARVAREVGIKAE
ncbi:MAG TPA: tripartite tricarboxylate transporter substrate binding protein [Burkholderiales bacterium]|jgi:tripartite-type tricarboxylate transporter receptor subunit TctC|nr:tripartite tricarboxylate transporter substrate binding protein [Burkholderiales bacterium]